MSWSPELLLVGTTLVVGVLHTIVPDHWAPIALIARQRGWSRAETARAALQAGTGHVVSTLVIALVVWLAGVAVATQFGHFVDTASSLALVVFGGWIAISALRDMRRGNGRGHGGHGHSHDFSFLAGQDRGPGAVHGPELQRIETGHGVVELSIFEEGAPPRFRLSGVGGDKAAVETRRASGERQVFTFADRGGYLESLEIIPEPHAFEVTLTVDHHGHAHDYRAAFVDHAHDHHGDHGHAHDGHSHDEDWRDDPLYAPSRGDVAVLVRHVHLHRHGEAPAHAHWHDHDAATAHDGTAASEATPPLHAHKHKTSARTALLLILGSSPMVEGIPAFFAAGKYGLGLILAMSVVLALSTILTYVLLCVYSTAGLRRLRLGAFERYGEVSSGAFIALVGLAFWVWPVL
jgi:hypothetical protein